MSIWSHIKKSRFFLRHHWLCCFFVVAVFSVTMVGSSAAQVVLQGKLLAGSNHGPGFVDGTLEVARFSGLGAVTTDKQGNAYFIDFQTIRKMTASGEVITIAGQYAIQGSVDGIGATARFYNPAGLAVDGDGNIYVADANNHAIRKITPTGTVSTWVGKLGVAGNVDGTGSVARFCYPQGIAVDKSGNVYVGDSYNRTIRKITPLGEVSTLAGTAGVSGFADGTGTAAQFSSPGNLAVDGDGNIYVAEVDGQIIRKITPSGVVTTLAGSPGLTGSDDGTGRDARFNDPQGITVDVDNNVYVADQSNRTIRKITPSGVVITLAGAMDLENIYVDGSGGNARFGPVTGIAFDPRGSLVVTDPVNYAIRKVSLAGDVSTLSGGPESPGSVDGTGSRAQFGNPGGVAVDAQGNAYVADSGNSTIRKITPEGVVTTLAGSPGQSGFADGTGSEARFSQPFGVAVDRDGYIYVADAGNVAIRKITPDGVVSTLAKNTASSRFFSDPRGLAIDTSKNIYVADAYGCVIHKISPSGEVSTLAGSLNSIGSKDGDGSSARFNYPTGIAVDEGGTVYVADRDNGAIRKITPAGRVSTIARSSSYYPTSVVADNRGNLYVASGYDILVVTPAGSVVSCIQPSGTPFMIASHSNLTFDRNGNLLISEQMVNRVTLATVLERPAAETGAPIVEVDFTNDTSSRSVTIHGMVNPHGLETSAYFEYGATAAYGSSASITLSPSDGVVSQYPSLTFNDLPVGGTMHYRLVATNSKGTVALTDHAFCILHPYLVSTLAGKPGAYGYMNGTGSAARFYNPYGVAADSKGNVYVADETNHAIRKITPAGVVSTLAGGSYGFADGMGQAAQFVSLNGITVDGDDNVYITDSHRIRKITPAGNVTSVAGNSISAGYAEGTGVLARFKCPMGITVDAVGNLYVADTGNSAIRKITPEGGVTTLAGGSDRTGWVDGTGSAAQFDHPSGISVDGSGNIYVADTENSTIRKVTPEGVVSTLAGIPRLKGYDDGIGSSATFFLPFSLAVDKDSNVYVADYYGTIRFISPFGFVSTVAGRPGQAGSVDGVGSTSRFYYPFGITADRNGNVYVADTGSHTVRKLVWGHTISLRASPSDGGLLSGDGVFAQSDSLSITTTPNEAYQFTNWTENGAVVSTEANYTFTVSGDRILVANFTMKPFYQWWSSHVPGGGVADLTQCGPAATPRKDGTPNVLKYLCGIDPAVPLGEADKGALPVMDVNDVGPRRYLTLTHRKNPAANELTVQVQVSTDLLNWVTVTPDSTQTVGHDGVTGDPLVEYQVDTQGATQKFIRLNVVAP